MPAMTRTDANVDLVPSGTRRQDTPAPASEYALMQQLSQGNHDAMQMLIEQHGPMMARLIGRLTAWRGEREDILQDVLVRVWEKAGTFDGRGSLEGWLRRITVHQCHNHRRAARAFQRIVHALTIRTPGADGASDASGDIDTIALTRSALDRLDQNDRTVLVLFHLEDLKGEEIARVLSISEAAVHTRLHRARRRLRVILERVETDR